MIHVSSVWCLRHSLWLMICLKFLCLGRIANRMKEIISGILIFREQNIKLYRRRKEKWSKMKRLRGRGSLIRCISNRISPVIMMGIMMADLIKTETNNTQYNMIKTTHKTTIWIVNKKIKIWHNKTNMVKIQVSITTTMHHRQLLLHQQLLQENLKVH